MPQGSAELNPIEFSSYWHRFKVAGVSSPGVIPNGGIRGFDRPVGWDKKKGKGTQGATLTLSTFPPAEGSITIQLWTPAHFIEWKAFRALLKYKPTKSTKTAADSFEIYYPSLADLDVNACVCAKISPTLHVGKGLYEVTIDFIEFLKPPPVSIVKTPNKSSTADKSTLPGVPPDPIADAQQREIADLMKQAAATPVG